MQFAAEEIEGGGKSRDGVGRADDPAAAADGLRGVGVGGIFFVVADEREGGGGFLLLEILGAVHGHRHVGLAGAEPDFADEDVLERDGVVGLDGEGLRVGGDGEVGEGDLPFAVVGGGGGLGLAGECDGDFLAGRGDAPNGDAGAALQHHVVGEDGGERYIGPGGQGAGGEGEESEAGKRTRQSFHAKKGWIGPAGS